MSCIRKHLRMIAAIEREYGLTYSTIHNYFGGL